MNKLDTYVAFSIQNGLLHLCLDSASRKSLEATSLCRDVTLGFNRAPVDKDDLGNIQNLIICKGCEVRYHLLGYRAFYAPEDLVSSAHPNQLLLF
jgi:hypothetical protein